MLSDYRSAYVWTIHFIVNDANTLTMIDVFVGQVMTKNPITVNKSQLLSDAGTTMIEASIKSVVATDSDDYPVGILTSTDFLQMAADEHTPTEATVDEYMTREIVTTTPDTEVRTAADQMMEHDISHLPVVGTDDRLTAIITTTDVARYVSGIEVDG